jgi:hypothetical protein
MEKDVAVILRLASDRALPSLLIGANALIKLGYIRNTVDLDLLVPEESRSQWLDVMRELGYRLFHGGSAFAQFEPGNAGAPPVDLMFVDQATPIDIAGENILIPRPEHLVALKLHAANSSTRTKPELDWEDIRQIVRICALDPEEEPFGSLILRYGGEGALQRIRDSRKQ